MRFILGFQQWINQSFANRAAVLAAVIASVTAIMLSVLSFQTSRALVEENAKATFQFHVDSVVSQLEIETDALIGMLDVMSKNAFISNALVDSLGREQYLVPFLRDQAFPGKWQGELWLVDFQGNPISSNVKNTQFAFGNEDAINNALLTGELSMNLVNKEKLLVAAPVEFPPTKTTEGAVVAIVDFKQLILSKASIIPPGECLVLRFNQGTFAVPNNCLERKQLLQTEIETIPQFHAGFSILEPKLILYVDEKLSHSAIIRLVTIHLLVMAFLLLGVFFVSRSTSRRLVTPLTQLTKTANDIVNQERLDLRASVDGKDEFGKLARSFNHMLDNLHQTQLQLVEDIRRREELEAELIEEKEKALVTLQSIGDAVVKTDNTGVIEFLNPVAERILEVTLEDVHGKELSSLFTIVDDQTREVLDSPVTRCLEERRTIELATNSILITQSGKEYDVDHNAAPIRDGQGHITGVVLVFHDVSEMREMTRKIAHDAAHDPLTGLVNRREFEVRVEHALQSAREHNAHHVLCFLDLDQFKIVNDTAGHAAGDELLCQISGVLSGIIRQRDTVARLGGDEFGLLLDNCPLERAMQICQAIVDGINEYRFAWDKSVFTVGVSIGITTIDLDTENVARAMTQADVACYVAKDEGRGRIHVWESSDSESARRHDEILRIANLKEAVSQGKFLLYAQPIVPLDECQQAPLHYELLLRMLDDKKQVLLPDAFIPAAERYGLMGAIDRWVIQSAFTEYSKGVYGYEPRISLNLSGNTLNDEKLLEFIDEQFKINKVNPDEVCFEITETAAVHSLSRAGALMRELKSWGCKIALDDFGSGLSSFRYLKDLPIDYLKIDGSFVKDILQNKSDLVMVSAITEIAKTMGIQVIAEHVPNQKVANQLRMLGVDYVQGFGIGEPVPAANIKEEIA